MPAISRGWRVALPRNIGEKRIDPGGIAAPPVSTRRTKWTPDAGILPGCGIYRDRFPVVSLNPPGGAVPLSDAGGPKTTLVAPGVKAPQTIHVILQLEDNGTPRLGAYCRAILTVQP